ncbi:MAG: hypothetical protein K0V04_01650 [Deltaproteobacteria bacterium]|nr:hypothetical protein [Deltaproteobacteria bacterium]
MRGLFPVVIVVGLSACRTGGAPAPEPDPPTKQVSSADEAEAGADEGAEPRANREGGDDCVSLVEVEVVEDAFDRGVAKLEQSREGEHYRSEPFEEAMGALKFAGDNGHLAASSLYGRTLFSVMFVAAAPTEERREDYVSALTALRVAALRGDIEAQQYVPGLMGPKIVGSEPPLNDLPGPWVTEATERAEAWLTCHRAEAEAREASPL